MEIREENRLAGPHFYRSEGRELPSDCWRYAVDIPGLGTWGVDVWIDSSRTMVDAILERVPGASVIHNQLRGKRKNPTALAACGQFYDLLSVSRFDGGRFRRTRVKDRRELPSAFPRTIRLERAGDVLGEEYQFKNYLIALVSADRPAEIASLLICQHVLPLQDVITYEP